MKQKIRNMRYKNILTFIPSQYSAPGGAAMVENNFRSLLNSFQHCHHTLCNVFKWFKMTFYQAGLSLWNWNKSLRGQSGKYRAQPSWLKWNLIKHPFSKSTHCVSVLCLHEYSNDLVNSLVFSCKLHLLGLELFRHNIWQINTASLSI